MIKTVKESGFCYGVQAAVRKADSQKAEGGGQKIYLYGDLVNNQHVMDGYKKRGFIVAGGVDEVSPGSVVIIRAHGVPKAVYENLEKKAEVVDCTCPKVKSIHRIVQEKSAAGYLIVIVGKSGHPEVEGTFGWCEGGRAVVAGCEADLTNIPEGPVCVVAQTTCKRAWWEKAVEIILEKNPDAEINDTLCSVTAERINKAVEIAKRTDLMVVAGDRKSANSLELYDACKDVCANVLFVSSLEELAERLAPQAIPSARVDEPSGGSKPDVTSCAIKNLSETGLAIGLAGSASAPAVLINEIHGFLLFSNFLAQAKSEIEAECDRHFDDVLRRVKCKPFVEDAVRALYEQNKNGKRVRGALIKLGEEIASGGRASRFLPVASAYELFQTAILIHDDIIDKSPVRRGKMTIHAAESDAHFGTSRAICIGDYGLFLANRIIAEADLEPELLVKALRLFSQIQLTTLEGEIMDVSLPYYPIDIAREYESYTKIVGGIFEYKTAWYTLAGPIMLGAICGGGDEKLLELLRDITLPLGVAFQIKDDLLGIYASEKALGKPALSDLIEKKQTLLYGYAYKHADTDGRERLDASYGKPGATEQDLETVREIFISTGAKDYCEHEIRRLSQESLELIKTAPDEYRPLLNGLVYYLITRRA